MYKVIKRKNGSNVIINEQENVCHIHSGWDSLKDAMQVASDLNKSLKLLKKQTQKVS